MINLSRSASEMVDSGPVNEVILVHNNSTLVLVLPWLGLGIFNKMDITQGGLL